MQSSQFFPYQPRPERYAAMVKKTTATMERNPNRFPSCSDYRPWLTVWVAVQQHHTHGKGIPHQRLQLGPVSVLFERSCSAENDLRGYVAWTPGVFGISDTRPLHVIQPLGKECVCKGGKRSPELVGWLWLKLCRAIITGTLRTPPCHICKASPCSLWRGQSDVVARSAC